MVQDSKAGARGYFGVNFTFSRRRGNMSLPSRKERMIVVKRVTLKNISNLTEHGFRKK